MGLSVNYLYSLTPRQFFNIVRGFIVKSENKLKDDWERTRRLVYAIYLSYETKGKKISMQDMMPFAWDKSDKSEASHNFKDLEEIKNVFKNIK